ncbi:hypothetical protein [Arthrobacter pigmenti]
MIKSSRRAPFRTVAEKMEILAEYEAAPRGAKGEVARRHNLGSSTIGRWAYARDHDEFGPGLKGNRSRYGRSAMTPNRQSAEIAKLRRELAKAQADREVLNAALESMGKAHALLEKLAESAEPEPLNDSFGTTQSPNSSPPE